MAEVAKRESIKTSILKLAKYVGKVNVNKVDLTEIEVREKALEVQWTRFQDAHDAVMVRAGVTEIEEQQEIFDEVETYYYDAAAKFTKIIRILTAPLDPPDHKDKHTTKLQALERLINGIKTYAETDGAAADTINIQIQLRELDRLYLQYEQLVLCSDIDADVTMNLLNTVQLNYRAATATLLHHNSKFNNNEQQQHVAAPGAQQRDNNVKLPRLEPPTFDGNILGWESFRDLYTSIIHEREDLSAVRKFQYLKSCMKGSAEPLLRNFALTNENYASAWQLLLDRYDNKKVLVTEHLRQLSSQPFCKESADDIKSLLNKTNESLRALENLKRPVDHWDDWVVFLVTQHLDAESRKLWEQSQCLTDDQPTWEDLQTFLHGRIRAIEATTLFKSPSIPSRNKLIVKAHQVTAESSKCVFCSKSHRLPFCTNFKRKSVTDKRNFVKSRHLCFNCLSDQHRVESCPSIYTCNKCHQKHHTLLHMEYSAATSSSDSSRADCQASSALTAFQLNENKEEAKQTSSSLVANCRSPQILLATALVNVIQPNGAICTLRALLDQGSHASFITDTAVRKLGLNQQNCNITLSGIGSTSAGVVKHCVSFKCSSKYNSNNIISVEALILKKVTSLPPLSTTIGSNWDHLVGLQLADPQYYRQDRIDLLLGAIVYSRILLGDIITGPPGSPTAQRTIFGWILSGECASSEGYVPKSLSVYHNYISIDDQLRKFWEIEQVPSERRSLTKDEQICEDYYANTYRRDETGRYIVRLPFINGKISVGASEFSAVTRQLQMERRFKQNSNFHRDYTAFMGQYLSLNHMEEVSPTSATEDSVYYIPHHAVIKESSSTTKLRVVFDASRKTSNGRSLNEQMYTGPRLQQNLTSIVMRWRKHAVVFVADIEKMYRQIRVDSRDADYQRIVWRPTADGDMRHFRLITVTYGTSSAPYLAIKTLQQLAIDEKDSLPIGSQIALHDFYVDDVLSGSNDINSALEAQKQLIALLRSGQFVLKKWASNRGEILSHLPAGFIECGLPLELNLDNGVKTLGICWNPALDEFSFKIQLTDKCDRPTKRHLLSDVARLYDPLGWLSPSIVIAKTMLQQLWQIGLAWDDPLPSELAMQWTSFRDNLLALERIKIPRWLSCHSYSSGVQIHGFCDASMTAYAASVYVRVPQSDNMSNVFLITAKSKVAPIKTISIPRLELCGAVLLAQLLECVVDAMDMRSISVHAWTDSTIVLAWLAGEPTRWNVFVANRCTTILQSTTPNQWNHVSSEDNPADCASRGVSPSELETHDLWWHGPQWLRQSPQNWPRHARETTEEERHSSHAATIKTAISWDLLGKYSSPVVLFRVTAYVRRFVSNCQRRSVRRFDTLDSSELTDAKLFWVKVIQKQYFNAEIKKISNDLKVHRGSCLFRLTPFLDEKGIVRVGGRVRNAPLSENERHPIILPKESTLTQLWISFAHKVNLHGGIQSTLAYIRREFWIIDSRNQVRYHIHRCVVCFKQKPTTQTQIMANLPSARITPGRPFLHTAVDYSGFIKVRTTKGRGHHSTKAYIALFVCLVTKAIHLEIVSDLTSTAFIAAFKRFTARRGLCSDIYSDNATNFVGASKILYQQRKENAATKKSSLEIRNALSQDGTNWHFSPPLSPHFNGLAEAGIRSTKNHLKRVIGESTLTYEELSTLIYQIEACLNSRPLYPLTDNPDELVPLTPGHFLIGGPLNTVPEPNLLDIKVTRLTRWQIVQQMLQQFWQRWSQDYFHYLYQRTKWTSVQPNLQIGNMVLIKEDNISPSKWPLGRIIAIYPGSDGRVRVVKVKTKNNTFDRSIVKVALLPISDNQ